MSKTINFEEVDFRKAVGRMFAFGALTGLGLVLLVAGLLLVIDESTGLLHPLIGLTEGADINGNDAPRSQIELSLLTAGVLLTGLGSYRWRRFLKQQRDYFNRLAMSNPPPLKSASDYV